MIPAYLGGRPVPAARPFVRPAAAHLRERFVLYGYAPPTEARVAGGLFQVGTRRLAAALVGAVDEIEARR